MAIYIEQPTPFLEEFFMRISELNYPKDKIHLLLRNNVPYHVDEVAKFAESESKYASFKQIKPTDELNESSARMLAM